MKFTYNWLKEYVNIKLSPKVLAEKLTMAGLEVTSLEKYGSDTVFEIEVTANRPDCLSILGVAQEVSAITQRKSQISNLKSQIISKLQIPNSKRKTKHYLKPNYIRIQDRKDCPFYRGCLITDVKVGPSPQWLRQRLESLGIRSINNIVDITNYCLLEFGQPLHAFDFDKIVENITVRRAKRGEKILAIDGVERELNEDILVISDKNKAIAIAGVMGDKLSEVGTLTKNILLESAYFDPVVVRRASRKLGLSSDSSYRFERGLYFQRVKLAQNKAIAMICEIAGGKFTDERKVGKEIKPKLQKIRFNYQRANEILSSNISKDKIKKIFSNLGFSARDAGKDVLSVNIPAIRRDIKMEENLVEELARIYGYDKIPSTLPAIRSQAIENPDVEKMKSCLRWLLSSLGFNEVITYSLLSQEMLHKAGRDDAVKLDNPLSKEQEYLRPTLLASLLNCLTYNLNHRNKDLKLFEMSHVFGADYSEPISLGLIATGKFMDNWKIKQDFDLFSLKGAVENLLNRLGATEIKFLPCETNNVFIKNQTTSIICQDKEIGFLGRINNSTLLEFGIKNPPSVFYAEISLTHLVKFLKSDKRFQPLVIYPSVTRDLSLIAKNTVRYQEIFDVIKSGAGSYLKDFKLVDIYKGEQIPKGFIGLTVSLELGLADRTLTDPEAEGIKERIVKRLKSDLAIQIR